MALLTFGPRIASFGVTFSVQGGSAMPHTVLFPTLALLGAAAASIPVIENSINRAVLYWAVLSPVALGLLGAAVLLGIR